MSRVTLSVTERDGIDWSGTLHRLGQQVGIAHTRGDRVVIQLDNPNTVHQLRRQAAQAKAGGVECYLDDLATEAGHAEAAA